MSDWKQPGVWEQAQEPPSIKDCYQPFVPCKRYVWRSDDDIWSYIGYNFVTRDGKNIRSHIGAAINRDIEFKGEPDAALVRYYGDKQLIADASSIIAIGCHEFDIVQPSKNQRHYINLRDNFENIFVYLRGKFAYNPFYLNSLTKLREKVGQMIWSHLPRLGDFVLYKIRQKKNRN